MDVGRPGGVRDYDRVAAILTSLYSDTGGLPAGATLHDMSAALDVLTSDLELAEAEVAALPAGDRHLFNDQLQVMRDMVIAYRRVLGQHLG